MDPSRSVQSCLAQDVGSPHAVQVLGRNGKERAQETADGGGLCPTGRDHRNDVSAKKCAVRTQDNPCSSAIQLIGVKKCINELLEDGLTAWECGCNGEL